MTTTDTTPNHLSGWDELRRAADQLELEIHLGSMDARDRWRAFRPQLDALEAKIADAGGRAGRAIASEIATLADNLRRIGDGTSHPDD